MSIPAPWPQVLNFFGTLNNQFVMLSLRQGNVHAALGADDDLEYLVTRLRQVWPDVVLHFRGDCGFDVPARRRRHPMTQGAGSERGTGRRGDGQTPPSAAGPSGRRSVTGSGRR
jgi:hypothetical protein